MGSQRVRHNWVTEYGYCLKPKANASQANAPKEQVSALWRSSGVNGYLLPTEEWDGECVIWGSEHRERGARGREGLGKELVCERALDFFLIETLIRNLSAVVVQSISHVQRFATPWTAAQQASWSFTKLNSHALSQWCHPTISSSVVPFSSCPQSFLDQVFFQWVSSSHQVAKVLEFQH